MKKKPKQIIYKPVTKEEWARLHTLSYFYEETYSLTIEWAIRDLWNKKVKEDPLLEKVKGMMEGE